MLPEPFQTLLVVFVIPVIVFAYRKAKAKWGAAASDAGLRWLTFGLSAAFVIFTGQVAGLHIPAWIGFPAGGFGGPDAIGAFIAWSGDFLMYVGVFVSLAGAVFAAATGVYKLLLQFILAKAGLQTAA